MRLKTNQLLPQLHKPLAPVFLVSGDEPLQRSEALDAIRRAAREQGYTERELLEAGPIFDWSQLTGLADNLSLFGDKRIIELRLISPKIGNEGGKTLLAYLERPPEDTVLLITSPRLERAQYASKWVKAIERHGVLVNVWPVDHKQLPGWLRQRMRTQGLHPEEGVTEWLAERVEGNLLAAVQEVEKLRLLQGPGPLSLEQITAAASDSARYTVFDLADAALAGDSVRAVRITRTLRAEGSPEPLVLWALSKEVRLLAGLAGELSNGQPLPQLLAARRDIMEKRRPLYTRAIKHRSATGWRRLLARCAEADRTIKGGTKADPWLQLEGLALGLCGARLAHLDKSAVPMGT